MEDVFKKLAADVKEDVAAEVAKYTTDVKEDVAAEVSKYTADVKEDVAAEVAKYTADVKGDVHTAITKYAQQTVADLQPLRDAVFGIPARSFRRAAVASDVRGACVAYHGGIEQCLILRHLHADAAPSSEHSGSYATCRV